MADNNTVIGLDIDDKSIKLVKIKINNQTATLLRYAVKEIPQSTDKLKSAAEALKALFKGEKSDIPVYSCAWGNNVSIKRMTIPVMPDDEISEAIKWEAKNISPFPIENSSIAYFKLGQISEKSIDKFDILFAISGEEQNSFFTSLVKEAGIKISGVSAMPFALGVLLENTKKFEKDKITAIIDIGGEAASINLFKGNQLQFTREITVAGDSFTKTMTGLLVADHWQLNLTYEQAEEIKKRYGIPQKDTSETTETGVPLIHIYEMLAPTLRRLQNELIRSFDYYKEQYREEKVDQIFLTGGSSSLANLSEFLSNALGTKVLNIDPLEDITIDKKSNIDKKDLGENASRLCLAFGLALDRGKKVNFLKSMEKKKSSFALPKNISDLFKGFKLPTNLKFSINFGLVALVLIAAGAISYNVYLSNEIATYKKQLVSKQMILADVKSLVDRKAILEAIASEESHMRETLSQISAVLPQGVTLSDLVFENSKKQIWISGLAPDTKTVGKLVKDIEASPYFKNTILIEARRTMQGSIVKALFRITFNLDRT